jgi:hypothetical protein
MKENLLSVPATSGSRTKNLLQISIEAPTFLILWGYEENNTVNGRQNGQDQDN